MKTRRNAFRCCDRLFSCAWPAAKAVATAAIIGTIGLSAALLAESGPRISIYVYNGGQVPAGTLRKAQDGAASILEQAGIKTTWREPKPPVTAGAGSQDLWVPTNIEVRIYDRPTINEVPVEEGVTGFVWSFENNIAAILYDRVRNLAASEHAGVAPILGIAMAHEIGRLLLRSREQSSEGIMRQNWPPGDLQSAAQGRLRFTAEQSQRMRDEVLRWGSQSQGAELKVKPALQVRVQVYNGARVSSRDLLRAEERAARVFRKANITVVWITASTPTELDTEAAHEQWVPGDLQLRIWTRSLARPSMIHSDALGFCSSIEGGQAVVLFDAVRGLARIRRSDPADLLGLAIAHEMGHILLRSVNHSTAGMMRARWLPKDLHDAQTGSLVFTREQVESMQNEVRRRMRIQTRRDSC